MAKMAVLTVFLGWVPLAVIGNRVNLSRFGSLIFGFDKYFEYNALKFELFGKNGCNQIIITRMLLKLQRIVVTVVIRVGLRP